MQSSIGGRQGNEKETRTDVMMRTATSPVKKVARIGLFKKTGFSSGRGQLRRDVKSQYKPGISVAPVTTRILNATPQGKN
jgi:hypothetical protein